MSYFSVILPAYNTPSDTLKRAIHSVLSQTYPYFELIIVDDGSTPSLEPIVKEYDDERIVFIRHEQNKGAGAAHNTGIKTAKYDWIAFICHDDEWLPEKLEAYSNIIKNNKNIHFIFSDYYFLDKKQVKEMKFQDFSQKYINSSFYELILAIGIIATSTIALKKEIFEYSGFYDETGILIDWDLYIRIFHSNKFKHFYLNKPITKYYYSEIGISHPETIHVHPRAGNDILKLFFKWKNEIKKYPLAKKAWSIRLNSIAKYYAERNNHKMALKLYLHAIKLNYLWKGNYFDLIKLFFTRMKNLFFNN